MGTYFVLEEPATLVRLYHPELCSNACFKFDKPLKLDTTDVLLVDNAAVYLLCQGIKVPIAGKWDRIKI